MSPPNHRRRILSRNRQPVRRGVVLLFVVVLLTLLAIIGSAFLISTRIDAGQVGPESRGAADTFGVTSSEQMENVRASTVQGVQLALAYDVFARVSVLTDSGAAEPSAERTTAFPGALVPDPIGPLIWRPSSSLEDGLLGGTGAGTNVVPNNSDAVFDLNEEVRQISALPFLYFDAFDGTMDGLDNPLSGTGRGLVFGDPLLDQPLRHPYVHIDALGPTDPWLASRQPRLGPAGQPFDGQWYWPFVSAPLAGIDGMPVDEIFVDPFLAGGDITALDLRSATPQLPGTGPQMRYNLQPGTFAFGYPSPHEPLSADPAFYNDRVRVYPTLRTDLNGSVVDEFEPDDYAFLAADADGDGVADAGLVPIVFNNNIPVGETDRYFDPVTGLYYLIAIHVVDNNAAVNVNTAGLRAGDMAHFAGGIQTPVVVKPDGSVYETVAQRNIDSAADEADPIVATSFNTPAFTPPLATATVTNLGTRSDPAGNPTALQNYGIYRSSIALYELFPDWLDTNASPTASADGFGNDTREETMHRILATLWGDPRGMFTRPVTKGLDPISGLQRIDVVFGSYGEAAEFALAMPYGQTYNPLTDFSPTPFRSDAEAGSLAYAGGGVLRPGADLTRFERLGEEHLVRPAINFTPGSSDFASPHFALFPPVYDFDDEQARLELWARASKSTDPDNLFYDFNAAGVGIAGGSGTDVPLPVSPRAGLVTQNGVSMSVSPKTLPTAAGVYTTDLTAALVPLGMPAWAGVRLGNPLDPRPAVKASVNTTQFAELWRAYWSVMVSNLEAREVPDAIENGTNTATTIFRPDLFRGTYGTPSVATPYHALLLRSAIAAVNTMDLRDVDNEDNPGDNDITVAEVQLSADGAGGAAFIARVYGTEAQPFISEVLMDIEGSVVVIPDPAPGGVGPATVMAPGDVRYIAVELVNPYPFDILMDGWQLAVIDRSTGSPVITLLAAVEGTDNIIPAATAGGFGYYLFEGTNGAVAPGITPKGNIANLTIIPGAAGELNLIPNRELVLIRPVINGIPITALTAIDAVPLDSVDFTGMDPAAGGRYRYARDTQNPRDWKFTHHGDWELSIGIAAAQQVELVADPLVDPGNGANLGFPSTAPGTPAEATGIPPDLVIPLGPVVAGPIYPFGADVSGTPVSTTAQPAFPYGGFARAGDVLGVPFIGGYRISVGGAVQDITPVTLDAFFAEDPIVSEGSVPGLHVGRFIANQPGYGWAGDLLDYVTTLHAPGDDHFPMIDARYGNLIGDLTLDMAGLDGSDLTPNGSLPAAWLGFFDPLNTPLFAAARTPLGLNDDAEAYAAVEGLLNILTADEGILKAMPLVMTGVGGVDPAGTAGVAQSIAGERSPDGAKPGGPFIDDGIGGLKPVRSLFELNDLATLVLPVLSGAQPTGGDLTGFSLIIAGDNEAASARLDTNFYDATADYEQITLNVQRLGNLTTTRSDSYTVYLVVQAWENVGSNGTNGLWPRLVRQERVAFTVDRSGLTPDLVDPLVPLTQFELLNALEVTPLPAVQTQ